MKKYGISFISQEVFEYTEGAYYRVTEVDAALAEKERSVHEKYKAELITQNDQLDRYEEQISALEKRISDAGILKLAAENAALTARIKELEESLTYWKKQWGYMEAAQKQGEARIKELEGALETVVCGIENNLYTIQEIKEIAKAALKEAPCPTVGS
jgi:chromosome segregation ATPase